MDIVRLSLIRSSSVVVSRQQRRQRQPTTKRENPERRPGVKMCVVSRLGSHDTPLHNRARRCMPQCSGRARRAIEVRLFLSTL